VRGGLAHQGEKNITSGLHCYAGKELKQSPLVNDKDILKEVVT